MRNYLILKYLCEKIYLLGPGNFWYEDGVVGNHNSFKYKFLSTLLFFIYVSMTALEIVAALVGKLPKDEKSDSVSFAVSHTIVMIKIFSVMYNREVLKVLNLKLVQVCEPYEEDSRAAENYRIIKINVYAYAIAVYGSTACFIFEAIRKMLTGSHFITIVTIWPFFEDDSTIAFSFRIFTTLVLCVMMTTMISIDSFTVLTLIIYKYKFVTLRYYFENLRVEFDRNNYAGNNESATDRLQSGLIEGIVMHKTLLRLSKDIDKSFGTVMALQVCQSSGSAVSLLLQIALSKDLTFVAQMKLIFFGAALFFLLALFLCNAGEITYQASLISDSIFYCGWHACAMRRDLRRLVLLSCAYAQRPLVMKAFKMLQLTYGTFILVVRSTYSVFALFYAQNE